MSLLHIGAAFIRKHMSAFIVPLVISLVIVAALAFSVPVHRGITKDTLATITAQVAGKPKNFSKRALEEIQDANESVDDFLSLALFHPERHFTDESFVESSTRLRDIKTQIITKLTAERPNGDEARKLLGQALHTVQDFYAHSNWVELGNSGINTALGRSIMSNPATTFQPCPSDSSTLGPNGGGGLTSGYYIDAAGCGPLPYPGKCYHGNYYLFYCSGINKDKPGLGQHGAAVTVAEAATKDYVQQILSEIAGNDKAIKALLDLKGTLGFVIDDTGSMGPEIAGVKSTVAKTVNEARANPDSQPDSYLLVRFGDPDVGSAFVTDNADALLSAVNALSPAGGGDCPELSQAALLEAIDKSSLNSQLYLFTDASAKDSSLRNEVISRAQEKRTNISYAPTSSCSPIDEAYIRGAAETGGQLFNLSASEIPQLFDLIKPQLSGDLGTILSTRGVIAAGTPRVFNAPVDSTVRRLVVSVSIDTRTAISLRRPSGVLVNPSDPDAQITDLASARFLTINAPSPGTWQVEISGSGNFSVVAKGNSPIDFYRFDFVKPSGDIHGGFSPIPGQPLAGSEGTGEAAVLGSFATGTFKFVNEGGETIREINLAQNYPDAAPDHFVGMFLLPNVPFRVVATGTDLAGFQYQRTFPTVYRAQVVGVEINAGASDVVLAGTPTTFSFTVKNLGGPASFGINVVSSLGSISGINPTVLSLAAGASGTVQFAVNVPAGTPSGTTLAVTMTATKTDDSTVFNNAILNLVVAIPRIALVDPVQGAQGQTLNLTIRGENTTFVNGTSVASFSGTGITVNSTTVINPTTAVANVTLAPDAPLGLRDAFVTSGSQVAAELSAFLVLAPDTVAPVITCPSNVVATAAAGEGTATVSSGAATAIDDRDGAITPTAARSDGQALTAPYPIGVTTITWSARDAANNAVMCLQTVTVNALQSIQLGAVAYMASESANFIPITVTRTGSTALVGPATISFATSDGSARQLADYSIASGMLFFEAGESSKTFNLLINEDNYVEGDETFTVTLSDPTGSTVLGSQVVANVTIIDNDTGPPTFNPIDDAMNFVRQNYHDILAREPDPDGLNYWTNEITQCGTDAACITRRRSEVASAFFIEEEFQRTGFFLYLVAKSTFGVRPSYINFMRDRSSFIGPDLEAGKTAFLNAWVQRSEFLARYQATQSGMQFVDALLTTVQIGSGITFTTAERDALIADFNVNGSRARVLRLVVENARLQQAEYNPAFVLTQYFGNLRRNPDEGGYQFWLDVLNNRVPGNYRSLVCAFITSREYQERFSSVVTRTNQQCGN